MAATTATAALEDKIDRLTDQVAFLTQEAMEARTRRQRWEELADDLTPIANQAMEMATEELETNSTQVSMEDLVRLMRRFLSSFDVLEKSLVQLDSLAQLGTDAAPIVSEAVELATSKLTELDEKGYFTLAKAATGIADHIVTSFTEEDVVQLGDNVVTILETMKEMTQPEVMGMLKGTAFAIQESQHEIDQGTGKAPSLIDLAKQMRDPEVRRGMDRTLGILRTLSHPDNSVSEHAAQSANSHK